MNRRERRHNKVNTITPTDWIEAAEDGDKAQLLLKRLYHSENGKTIKVTTIRMVDRWNWFYIFLNSLVTLFGFNAVRRTIKVSKIGPEKAKAYVKSVLAGKGGF